MGSGEFDGGGSVKWTIKHSKGDNGQGDPSGGHGKDKDPDGPDATFLVYADDEFKFALPAKDHHKVRVFWGPESLVALALRSSTKKKKKGGKKKAKWASPKG